MTEHRDQEGAEPRTATPDEFAKFLRTETARWSKVARDNHLRLE